MSAAAEEVDRLLAQFEVLGAGWRRGELIRPNSLDGMLQRVMDLARASKRGERERLLRGVNALARAIDEARQVQSQELSKLPSRRRAVHAMACLKPKTAARLRMRA